MISIFERILPIAAWGWLAFIAFATLSPIAFRPIVAGIETEHILAIAVLVLLFDLAYPRHALMVLVLVLAGAVLLELLQLLIPGRHGLVLDVLQKWGGALVGAITAYASNRYR